MSAASPAYRGYLADVDCRWNVIAGSVDDRTPGERGIEVSRACCLYIPPPAHMLINLLCSFDPQPLKEGERRIPKSRYDSVDSYMSSDPTNRPEYNDNDVPVDEEVKKRLLDHGTSATVFFSPPRQRLTWTDWSRTGLDEPLAHHIAHLYIRDPLVIFTETLNQPEQSTDHFEVSPRLASHRSQLYLTVSSSISCAEHPIDELADAPVQAPSSQLSHRLACRVPKHGGSANRL